MRGLLSANLGIEAVLTPVITIGVGAWLDNKFGWSPWGLVVGALIGGSIFVVLLRVLMKQMKNDD